MDAFAFPSKFEGLGIALIEAQAAGLPVIISPLIPEDALIPGHWSRRIALDDAAAWARTIIEAVQLPPEVRTRSSHLKFDIEHNFQELRRVYGSC